MCTISPSVTFVEYKSYRPNEGKIKKEDVMAIERTLVIIKPDGVD